MSVRGLVRVPGFDELRVWLQRRFGSFRCVSFDVFDTLVSRCIEPPEDLQRRVATLLAERLGPTADPETILRLRMTVEAELRRRALSDGLDHECHFDPLVESWIERLVGHPHPELVDFVHRTEREIESHALAAKPGAGELLAWLRSQGIRVIAVSDMYLSHDHIAGLLDDCGLGSLVERLYVSSEFGLGKYSGRLHAKVLELEGLRPEEVVHVGDNFMSDMVAPVRLGMAGVFLDERKERLRRRHQSLSAEMARLGGVWKGRRFFEVIAQRMTGDPATGFFRRYGAEVLGPAFCTFTLGLEERLKAFRPDKVFFLARDGFIFQQMHRRWRQLNDPAGKDDSTYMYVSRRVVAIASVAGGLAWEQAIAAFYNPKQQGLLSVLKTYGLPPDEFTDLAAEHGFSEIREPIRDWRDPRLLAFLADERVQARIRPRGEEGRELLRRYFEQNGFFSARRVAFVDIGWNGTIQKFLNDSFGQRPDYPEVRGYYFAFVAAMHGDCGLGDKIEGLMYDARRGHAYERTPFDFEEIFEQGARSIEATTLGYREREGRVEPVLKGDDAPDRQEELLSNPLIEACQVGMMDHLDHFHAAVRLTGYGFDDLKPYVLALLERAVAYPTPEEVDNIGKLAHTEDFGHDHTLAIAGESVGYLDFLRPRRLVRKLRHKPWKFAAFASFGSIAPAWLFRLAYFYLLDRRRL